MAYQEIFRASSLPSRAVFHVHLRGAPCVEANKNPTCKSPVLLLPSVNFYPWCLQRKSANCYTSCNASQAVNSASGGDAWASGSNVTPTSEAPPLPPICGPADDLRENYLSFPSSPAGTDDSHESAKGQTLPVHGGSPCGGNAAQATLSHCMDGGSRHSSPFYSSCQSAFDIAIFSLPLATQNVLGYSLNTLSGSLIGRLGPTPLSASTLANSAYSITGLSLVWGGAAGLETLCGQAYGTGSRRLMRLVLLRAVLLSWAVCVPVTMLWLNAEALLTALGQSPTLVAAAASYLQSLAPSLFAYALSESLQVYLVVQGLTGITTLAKAIVTALGPLYYWVCMFGLNLGLVGAGYAYALCKATNAVILLGCVLWRAAPRRPESPDAEATAGEDRTQSVCRIKETPDGLEATIARETSRGDAAIDGVYARLCVMAAAVRSDISEALDPRACREYVRFAVPAAMMCCLEWWAYEALVIMAGWLPNADLAVGCLGICLTVSGMIYMLPQAVATATCARVSSALGAGNAAAAKRHFQAGYGLVVALQAVLSACLLPNTDRVAAFFCPNPAAAVLTASLLPLTALNTLGDGMNAILNNGVLRACGRQALGARLLLLSYWCCGLPAAYFAAFKMGWGVAGLVAAIGVTSLLQSLVMGVIISRWDWEAEVHNSQILLSKMA